MNRTEVANLNVLENSKFFNSQNFPARKSLMLRIFWSFRTPDSTGFLVEHVSILLLKLCRQILCIGYHVTELTLYQELNLKEVNFEVA